MIPEPVQRILRESQVVAVVGWSENPGRPSHWIASYLERAGYRVYRINPLLAGKGSKPVLAGLAQVPEPIDVVDVFRAPQHVPEVLEQALAARARVFWMQPGAENTSVAAQAQAAGMEPVLGRCMYADHQAWKAG